MFAKIKEWWLSLWREKYEITIYYPGEKVTLADGSTVEKEPAEKTFSAKKILKKNPKHFIWIDLEDRHHELKFLTPVVFHIVKVF
jgi:hypothetical protein